MTSQPRLSKTLAGAAAHLISLPANAACPSLPDHLRPTLRVGAAQSVCQYQGKAILVVNAASSCGLTGQYAGLESVYHKYRDRGLVMIGFPSNQFGKQEPGSNRDVVGSCRMNHGVKVPLMAKSDIAAPSTNGFYKQLIAKRGSRPKWNFRDYRIDRSTNRVDRYRRLTASDGPALLAQVERRLAEKP